MNYPVLRLKEKSLKSLKRRHPWIFSGGLFDFSSDLREGDKVKISDSKGRILGTGHYGERSIAVRILSFSDCEIHEGFYRDKLENAAFTRKLIGLPNRETNAYRLVHGEGDGLPGLIIDVYDRLAVVQTHSQGMSNDYPLIHAALKSSKGIELDQCVHLSAEKGVVEEYQDDVQGEVGFLENGMHFYSNWQTGQKTGFFLDQRDNRALLGSLSKGKNVLNAFSYTGGFSVYALKAGAAEVHSLDSSAPALELGERHVELNSVKPNLHQSIKANALDYFKDADLSQYDIMVIDPPAFAKHRSARHKAIQAYKRLNAAAFKKAKEGGLIMTFSCSQVVTPDLFHHTVASAAMEAGRSMRVLKHLRQPPDHPVSIYHPEGEYLKGLLVKVD